LIALISNAHRVLAPSAASERSSLLRKDIRQSVRIAQKDQKSSG
jgi:hypothetical protein